MYTFYGIPPLQETHRQGVTGHAKDCKLSIQVSKRLCVENVGHDKTSLVHCNGTRRRGGISSPEAGELYGEGGILNVEGRSALTCRVNLQAQLPGARGRLGPGMDVKLAEYVGNVTFYCLFGNVEFIAYLEVGAIGDKQLQHIEFAGGKRFR